VISGYEAGYHTGRFVTKLVKVYVLGKLYNSVKSVILFPKCHEINSKNPELVTENVFECLQYLD
jgi:hypothetical protein